MLRRGERVAAIVCASSHSQCVFPGIRRDSGTAGSSHSQLRDICRGGYIAVVLRKESLLTRCSILKQRLSLAPVAPLYVLHIVGVGDRGENSQEAYHDHQLDQGKAFVVLLHAQLPITRQDWRPMLDGSG